MFLPFPKRLQFSVNDANQTKAQQWANKICSKTDWSAQLLKNKMGARAQINKDKHHNKFTTNDLLDPGLRKYPWTNFIVNAAKLFEIICPLN